MTFSTTSSHPCSDVLIVGGGIIGLSLALELRLRGASVTVLSHDRQAAAAYAAAGMLAPQAEGIEAGPLRSLCLRSRDLYPQWSNKIETLTGLDSGYWPCGILRPVYDLAPSAPPADPEHWLSATAMAIHQPQLSAEVIGGWWFPQDGQVDNRRCLIAALRVSLDSLGVTWLEGVEALKIEQDQKSVRAIATTQGDYCAEHYVLTGGAWSGQLLEGLHPLASLQARVRVTPRKGQMLSLRPNTPNVDVQALGQVLFGDRIYIVPRRDGLVVVGATSEDVGFLAGNTAAGISQLLNEAIRLYPPLADYRLDETWWGFRPETQDEWPILGPSPLDNLSLGTGHYRNGILLAPVTAQLLTDWILDQKADPLLPAFRWDRPLV